MCQQIMNGAALTANALTQKHRMQFVNLALWPKIPESTLDIFGINVAHCYHAIPIKLEIKPEKSVITVAIDDPTNTEKIEILSYILRKYEVIFYITTRADMTQALQKRYSEKLFGSRS